MKKQSLFLAALLAVCGCANDSTYDYLPATAEKGNLYGFVDASGNLYQDGEFKYPSPVIEGVFHVLSDGSYALYKFDKKKCHLISEDFAELHNASEGKIIAVRKGETEYEVMDLKGKTMMKLDKVCKGHVNSCEDFKNGLLIVNIDNEERFGGKYAVIDEKGSFIVKPGPEKIIVAGKNLIFKYEDNKWKAVDVKGQALPEWKLSDRSVKVVNDYIVLRRNDDRSLEICDLKGKLIQKCSDKVLGINQISNGFVIFQGKGGVGAMSLGKGESIFSDKYQSAFVFDKGFVVKKNEKNNSEILNKSGEKVKDLEYIVHEVPGFANIGEDGNEWWVLNADFKPAHKESIRQFLMDGLDSIGSSYRGDCSDWGNMMEEAEDMYDNIEYLKKAQEKYRRAFDEYDDEY